MLACSVKIPMLGQWLKASWQHIVNAKIFQDMDVNVTICPCYDSFAM